MAAVPITETVISKVKEMTKKQGTTEVKYFNKDTELMSPNVDWEFGKEHKEDDEDCECRSQGNT